MRIIVTIQLQNNWEKALINGLEEGFRKSYMVGFDEYLKTLDEVVSFMPKEVKKRLRENVNVYKEMDFRIPFNYRENKKHIDGVYKEISPLYKEQREKLNLGQKELQDLRNIIVYVGYGKEKVLPREKREEIKITNFFNYLLNSKKIDPKYWEKKPVTDITISVSDKYVKILELVKIATNKGFYFDNSDGLYKTNLSFEDLVKSKEYLKNVKFSNIMEFFRNKYNTNKIYRTIVEGIGLSSLLIGPLPFIISGTLCGFSFLDDEKNKVKSAIAGTALIYFLNNFISLPILSLLYNLKGNNEIYEKIESKRGYVEEITYKGTPKIGYKFLEIVIKSGLFGGVTYPLYLYFKHPEIFNIEKDPNANIEKIDIIYYTELEKGGYGELEIDNNEAIHFKLNKIKKPLIRIFPKKPVNMLEILDNSEKREEIIKDVLRNSEIKVETNYPINIVRKDKKTLEEALKLWMKGKIGENK